jgi:hypothetical protein
VAIDNLNHPTNVTAIAYSHTNNDADMKNAMQTAALSGCLILNVSQTGNINAINRNNET